MSLLPFSKVCAHVRPALFDSAHVCTIVQPSIHGKMHRRQLSAHQADSVQKASSVRSNTCTHGTRTATQSIVLWRRRRRRRLLPGCAKWYNLSQRSLVFDSRHRNTSAKELFMPFRCVSLLECVFSMSKFVWVEQ